MEFSTPNAIRQIRANAHKEMWVDGKKSCPLQAMSLAFKYHKIDITDSAEGLNILGTVPVTSHSRKFIP
jgi:hypothetical protein